MLSLNCSKIHVRVQKFWMIISSPCKTMCKIQIQVENRCQKSKVFISLTSKSKIYHFGILQLKITTAIPLLLIIIKIIQISEVNMRKHREKWKLEMEEGFIAGMEKARLWVYSSVTFLSQQSAELRFCLVEDKVETVSYAELSQPDSCS